MCASGRGFTVCELRRAYVTKHVLHMRHDVDVRSLPRGRPQIGRFHVVLSGSERTSTS